MTQSSTNEKAAGRFSTEHIALASARRPWVVVGLWLVTLVIAVVLISTLLADALTTQFAFTTTPESQLGLDLIEELRGVPNSTNEVVIVQSDKLTVDDGAFQQAVEDIFEDLKELGPEVIRQDTLVNFYQAELPFLVSKDRQTTIMPFAMAGQVQRPTARPV